MVKLHGRAELAKGVEPKEGDVYVVTKVEEVKTAVQAFNGLRVCLEPEKRKKDDDSEYASMLWMRETAGVASKLGAFLNAFTEFLGDEDLALDTDNWLNHKVRIVSWKPRAREVRVVD